MDTTVERRRTVTAEDYVEILDFYARQMRLLDDLKITEYSMTFTVDGVVNHAHRAERAVGRQAMIDGMRATLPRYEGVVARHWFDHLLIEPLDGSSWRVSYYTLVTRTDEAGLVAFEPTFTVTDELVRVGDEILTRSRVIHRDTPDSNVVRGVD